MTLKNAHNNSPNQARFWEEKPLDEMNRAEWESLCDGCGRCCLVVLRDDETDEIHETDVACRLYDCKTRQCRDYQNRARLVPDCVTMTPELAHSLDWMPASCAYRRLARGEGLPDWHPLLTGSRQSVVKAGIATSANLLSAEDVHEEDLPDRVRAQRNLG